MENSMCLAIGVGGIHSEGYLEGEDRCEHCGAEPHVSMIEDRDPFEVMDRAANHMLERLTYLNNVIQGCRPLPQYLIDQHDLLCATHSKLIQLCFDIRNWKRL